jgi:hypothetical protein
MSFKCYIDLDGVMVDLKSGLRDKLGFSFPLTRTDQDKVLIDQMWDRLSKEYPRFWVDLDPLPGHLTLYREILKLDRSPVVLSATPEMYTGKEESDCRDQKISWVYKHLGKEQASRTIITKSKLKQNFIGIMPAHNHVLIDDMTSNIDNWNAAGGIGILHMDNQTTIERLKGLGS